MGLLGVGTLLGPQYLEFINLYVKIVLLSILVRGIFFLLPEKGYYFFKVVGMIFRYPVKRLFYFIYGVEVYRIDWEKVEIESSKVEDFDCLFTTNIIAPFIFLSSFSSFFLSYGSELFEQKYYWLGGILYSIGFIMVSFSIPDSSEVRIVFDANFQSSVKFLFKIVAIGATLLLINKFYPDLPFWISLIILGFIIVVPLYHYHGIKGKEKERNVIITTDPFF